MSESFSIEIDDGVTVVRINEQVNMDNLIAIVDEVAENYNNSRRLWVVDEAFAYSPAEIARLSERGRQHWPSDARVAYVASDPLSFGFLRVFEVYREQDNYQTRVFHSENDAMDWLRAWDG